MCENKHSNCEYLSCLAIVESEVVAGLEVEGNSGVGHALQVHGQNLLGHVVVVQLVVTESHVNFQGQEISERQDAVDLNEQTGNFANVTHVVNLITHSLDTVVCIQMS